jgi:hypothetical protein
MEPAAKRIAVPPHALRLVGPSAAPVAAPAVAPAAAPAALPHRVWSILVSTVRVLAVDTTRRVVESPDSLWHLSGWHASGTPVFVVLVVGNKAWVGQLGREIRSVDLAPVVVPLPGGGRQRVLPGRRARGGLEETFIDALFRASALHACSVAEATVRIARLDATSAVVPIDATRCPRYDRFVASDEDLWTTLIAEQAGVAVCMPEILELAPEDRVMHALAMIDQRFDAARAVLTPAMLWRIMASLAMHCYRFKFGWYAVSKLCEKLLYILGVSAFRLQQIRAASEPRPVSSYPELAARFPPSGEWPGRPGSMVHLAVSFEEACDLGYSFCHGRMADQMLLHGGMVYLGPDAASLSELRGRANMRKVDAMVRELRGWAARAAGGDAVAAFGAAAGGDIEQQLFWLSELAVPLAVGSVCEVVMTKDDLDDVLDGISCDSLQFEERRKIGKALALGLNTEDRAVYFEQFVEAMKKYKGGRARTDELRRWMLWYMQSRGVS